MINLKNHANLALLFFLIAALLGIFLRLFFVVPISANFRYIVHAHSHVALLGWVYLGLLTVIYKIYFSEFKKRKIYKRIIWFTVFTLVGMLFTFPFQGYAAFSITFSTLFLFASYFMTWFFFKYLPEKYKDSKSVKCIKAAFWYLVISSIGPWAIGVVMATLGNTSIWYKLSIYFYLHFQYNAWFILALCGILFSILEKNYISVERKDFKIFFFLLNAGLILSLFLSALWTEPPFIFYVLGGIGALLQFLAFLKFFQILKISWNQVKENISPFTSFLLKLIGFLLIGKITLQLLSAFPFFAHLTSIYLDFVIGYLHWTFLGLVSIGLLTFLQYYKIIKLPASAFWIYMVGFILSEVLIFYKAIALWMQQSIVTEYYLMLVGVSALLPISIGILLFINTKKRIDTNKIVRKKIKN